MRKLHLYKEEGVFKALYTKIKSGAYVDDLRNRVFARSKLTDAELQLLGYTQDQISGLKALNGDEPIQILAQIRLQTQFL